MWLCPKAVNIIDNRIWLCVALRLFPCRGMVTGRDLVPICSISPYSMNREVQACLTLNLVSEGTDSVETSIKLSGGWQATF